MGISSFTYHIKRILTGFYSGNERIDLYIISLFYFNLHVHKYNILQPWNKCLPNIKSTKLAMDMIEKAHFKKKE